MQFCELKKEIEIVKVVPDLQVKPAQSCASGHTVQRLVVQTNNFKTVARHSIFLALTEYHSASSEPESSEKRPTPELDS